MFLKKLIVAHLILNLCAMINGMQPKFSAADILAQGNQDASVEIKFPGKGVEGKTVILRVVTGAQNAARTDITRLTDVDVIVNAANERCLGGSGVDGAVHKAAGGKLCHYIEANFEEIEDDVRCLTGNAIATPAFNLELQGIRCIVHAVGPTYAHATKEQDLRNVYVHSLQAAVLYAKNSNQKFKAIAFPSISTGIYGYPKPEAAKIAINAIAQEIEQGDFAFEEVRFVLWPDTYQAFWSAIVDIKQKKSHSSR